MSLRKEKSSVPVEKSATVLSRQRLIPEMKMQQLYDFETSDSIEDNDTQTLFLPVWLFINTNTMHLYKDADGQNPYPNATDHEQAEVVDMMINGSKLVVHVNGSMNQDLVVPMDQAPRVIKGSRINLK